ncbi:Heat-labile enterotoxin alpha chain [Burkholderia sp. Ch1-1]|nr:Heat-labile enterotoxin alpha chain [Burkholderia sp. Ch1-1]
MATSSVNGTSSAYLSYPDNLQGRGGHHDSRDQQTEGSTPSQQSGSGHPLPDKRAGRQPTQDRLSGNGQRPCSSQEGMLKIQALQRRARRSPTEAPPAGEEGRNASPSAVMKPPVTSLPQPFHPYTDLPIALRHYNALYQPSAENNNEYLFQTRRGYEDWSGCLGSTQYVESVAAQSGQDLMAASSEVAARLEGRRGEDVRKRTEAEMSDLQIRYGSVGHVPLANHVEIPGRDWDDGQHTAGEVARSIITELANRFSRPFNPLGETYGTPVQFVGVTTEMSAPAELNAHDDDICAHYFGIQRLHQTGDYRSDGYEIFDNNYGAFRYSNFNQLSAALTGYLDATAPRSGRVKFFGLDYQAMIHVRQHELGDLNLGAVGGSYGIPPPAQPGGYATLTPPRADLPRPDWDRPGPSWRDELKKRSTDTQSGGLYRPSTVSPQELKARGGFNSEDTPLRNVNLDLHDSAVAKDPHNSDGGGYLGTYRRALTAQQKMPAKDGYIYDVAPSPNMVDVDGSLGAHARNPGLGEVAAMGRIDYNQVRGWWGMKNGEVGDYTANPDYRWDVYDQTSTAGAQPQLAGFAGDDPAWSDALHKPFIGATSLRDGKTIYTPKQDPNLSQAQFYGHALEKIQALANGQHYAGPVAIRAKDGWAGGAFGVLTPLVGVKDPLAPGEASGIPHDRVGVRNTQRPDKDAGSAIITPDGRIEFTDPSCKGSVMRPDSGGFLYADGPGNRATDKSDSFHYDEDHHLVSNENGQRVTYDENGYARLSATQNPGPFEETKSRWDIVDRDGKTVTPAADPRSYTDNDAGRADTQYRFERDPDSVLPSGTTSFVTGVPGEPDYGSFKDWLVEAPRGTGPRMYAWLKDHNAALLYRDGSYVVPGESGELKLYNLDGVAQTNVLGEPPRTYRVPDALWAQMQSYTTRRAAFEQRNETV